LIPPERIAASKKGSQEAAPLETRNQKLGTRLYCFLRQHLRNLLQEIINTSAGIDIRVHLGMSSTIRMHH
jgi:hypothetical protein